MELSNKIIKKTELYGARNYKPKKVVFSYAQGIKVTNPEGNEFYDMLSAYSALNFGHRHPEIIQAAKDQLDKVTLTSRAFHHEILGDFYESLCSLTNKNMILPMNTGAEAVETAIKAVRRWAVDVKGVEDGKQEIIVCENNFHGRTISIISMSTDPDSKRGFGPFTPGYKLIKYGDLEELENSITPNTAAFLMEPIQGEAGIIIPPKGFMKKAYELCKEKNVLFISDEVQTGFARTGKMFASEWEDVEPDIYILGKALGGGIVPISAIAGNSNILDVFEPGSHGSTFGGNPLACAVAIKSMEILVRDNYPQMALEKGKLFIEGLKKIKNENIVDIRGKGLLIGVEFSVTATPYVKKLIKNGILAKETHDKIIRFAPPITISYDEIVDCLQKITKALEE